MGTKPEPPESGGPTIEAALRYLGTRDHGVPVDLLEHAIDRPKGATGTALVPLTEPTTVLENCTPKERAHALWQVIQEGIRDPDVSPTPLSRRGRALQAAFRLPDADITKSWGSSLTERFKQLKVLTEVFGRPTSTQPMEMAWKKGVRALATYLEQRFGELQTPADWDRYRPKARRSPRPPGSKVAPIFIDFMVTTVFLRGRTFQRRITERLITAMAGGVDHYVMRGRPPLQSGLPSSVVTQAWGCRIEPVPFVPHGEIIARLSFNRLAEGDQHWFATEAVSTETVDERPWVNVPVNNYGIAEGRRTDHGIPTSGLTVRVVFDPDHYPAGVWFYTDPADRTIPPPAGDKRRLLIMNGLVSHTFEDCCEPRDEVGVAFRWD